MPVQMSSGGHPGGSLFCSALLLEGCIASHEGCDINSAHVKQIPARCIQTFAAGVRPAPLAGGALAWDGRRMPSDLPGKEVLPGGQAHAAVLEVQANDRCNWRCFVIGQRRQQRQWRRAAGAPLMLPLTHAFLLAALFALLWASSEEAGWGRKLPSQAFLLFSNTRWGRLPVRAALLPAAAAAAAAAAHAHRPLTPLQRPLAPLT